MRILFRYVFREFLIPLGYCLAGFLGIYILFELFGSYARLVEAKLPFGTTALYFAGYLSPYFLYLAPAALMLATLYTMWNFCRHSELTAMRASGVSLTTIVKPLLLAALLLAAFVGWVNESFTPTYALWAKRLRAAHFNPEEAERQSVLTYKDTDRGHSWVAAGYDAGCRHLTDVKITIIDEEDGTKRVYDAARADYLDGEWWLSFEREKKGKPVKSLWVEHSRRDPETGRPNAVCASPTPELDALPLRVLPELRERPGDLLMQSDGPQFASVRGKLRYLRLNDDLTESSQDGLRYDAWAQLLSPVACFVIVLLTIPAGITTGRQAVFMGVLGALGFFFAYYGFTIGCMVLAKTGSVPPIVAAFVPPVLFGALGVFFTRASLRETIRLLVIFLVLFAIYVLLAAGLERSIGLVPPMAHALAATLPLAGAILAFIRLRVR